MRKLFLLPAILYFSACAHHEGPLAKGTGSSSGKTSVAMGTGSSSGRDVVLGTGSSSGETIAMGTGSSNGGNSAVNENTGEVSFLDLVRIPGTIALEPHDLPAYRLLKKKLEGSRAYRGCTYMPFGEGIPSTAVAEHILLALDSLRLKLVMNGTRLPEPGDKGVVVLPSKDRKLARFALQIVKTGELWVDGQLMEKMSDEDIAAFLLHEALIRLWYFDPSNLETSKEEGHLDFGHLPTTDKIADIVNLTFSASRFAKLIPPQSLATKFCEAGLRVSSGAPAGLERLPLPSPSARRPEYPRDVFMFVNQDCSIRRLRVMGPWKTIQLKNETAQEISNLPDGAVDGRALTGRLHDRLSASYWKAWALPQFNDRDAGIDMLGKHRVPPVKVNGTLDQLPVREVYKDELPGARFVPPGNMQYLLGDGVESFWVFTDANMPPDELRLCFSLWRTSDSYLEYSGDGKVIGRRRGPTPQP
jgi:hypothetical protein